VDQSSSDFVRRTREESLSAFYRSIFLDILIRSRDIRDQILKLYKIDQNVACFGPNFLPPSPEFLDLHYKNQSVCNHVATFYDDRSRELGYDGGEIKNITGKI